MGLRWELCSSLPFKVTSIFMSLIFNIQQEEKLLLYCHTLLHLNQSHANIHFGRLIMELPEFKNKFLGLPNKILYGMDICVLLLCTASMPQHNSKTVNSSNEYSLSIRSLMYNI